MKKMQLIAVMVALLTVLSGCAGNQEAPANSSESTDAVLDTSALEVETKFQPKLQFSVVEAEGLGFTSVSREELGHKTDAEMAYGSLTEVNLIWDGETISLAEAIREEKLTVPELFAFARMDAHNGFCQETYTSVHGVTHYCYAYPECELWITYDVYKTPDGNQTLINEVYVYNIANEQNNLDITYVDEESEWGYFLDREDWGLAFETTDVSPTQINMNYNQQQSQEIGELSLDSYMLYSKAEGDAQDVLLAKSKRDTVGLPISIQSDGSGQFTIDWSDMAGALEPGEYYLRVTVTDNYDVSSVHPLMENYYDRQSYHIVFTIG